MTKYISSVPKISAKWALTGEHTNRWKRIWSSWGAGGPPRSACLIFPAGNDTFPDGPDRSQRRGDHHQRFIWVLATNNHMWTLHIVILFMNFYAITVHSQQLLCTCRTFLLQHSSGLCYGSWLHVLRWQTGSRLFYHATLTTSQYNGAANT